MVGRRLCIVLALAMLGCGPSSTSVDTASPDDVGSESTLGSGSESSESSGDSSESESDTGEASPPRVLFIGNSYTFFNDLPGLVAALGAASPTPITSDSLTMAGARVQDHLANPALAAKLAEGFDVVVIQGQSVEPITDYPAFETAVVELAGQIGEARYLLFQTWPRQEGSPDLIELGMTVEEMAQGLESGYFEAALASGGELAPVGGAWMSALQLEPPVLLYQADGSHPSLAGSFLAGCVFFDLLVERSCSTSAYLPPGLDPEQADQLRLIADISTGIVNPGP